MKRPVDWVDPLIDSGSRKRFVFFNSASRPFGMVNLSPDTRLTGESWSSGYRYVDRHIRCFSHIHAWQMCGIPVLPTTGPCRGTEGSEGYKSQFSHDKEIVKPGYHQVYLEDYKIKAELTSTKRVGFHRYSYDKAGIGWINIDLCATIMCPMSDCFAKQTGKNEISGYVENERTLRRPKRTKIFFVIQFDRDMEEIITWNNGEYGEFSHAVCGPGNGLAPKFTVKAGEQIQLKVAISYCSIDQARLNLDTELPHWDFDQVRQDASDEWNDYLCRIEVEGGTDAQMTKFYTDLFHAAKGRRCVSDVNGKYLDMTGDLPLVRQIPLDENGAPKYEHNSFDALWGAYWSTNLVWGMIWPKITNNFCNMMLDMYENGGLIPRGPSAGNYTHVMIAPTGTPFLTAAWMQGIRNFDIETAYEGILKNHSPEGSMAHAGYEHYSVIGGCAKEYIEKGYVPQGTGTESRAFNAGEGGAMTLEYAFHDWTVAQLAKVLGHEDDYKKFMKRSENYRNVWDNQTRYMRPRLADGSFLEPLELYKRKGWVEGTVRHYRWYVPHDPQSLIELMGGPEYFIKELTRLLDDAVECKFTHFEGVEDESLYGNYQMPLDYGNQPCSYIVHLFSYAGAPWLTQKYIKEIQKYLKNDITPYGGYGGDEDQGQMGALNVLMSIGLFSVNGMCNSRPYYEITSPVFDRITINLDAEYHGGGKFVIEVAKTNPDDCYIQSAELNGQPLEGPWLPRKEFVGGGRLKLVLAGQPNYEWGKEVKLP